MHAWCTRASLVLLLVGLCGFSPGVQLDAAPMDLVRDPDPRGSVDGVRGALEVGNRLLAIREAQSFVNASSKGRERTAAYLALGLLHRELGQANLASESFTQARLGGGPLAEWGAYYEAEQDYVRGRVSVAISECERYRQRWPDGHHRGDCLRLIALGQARLGKAESARESAEDYDAEHKLGPISEQVELLLARQAARHEPSTAIATLQQLAVEHSAPLTGREAEALLERLRHPDHDSALPADRDSRVKRALSLRDSRRRGEAWEAFEALVAIADDDPDLATFVEDEAERFGWRTHQWDFLADWYAREYATTGEPRAARSRYRVLGRAGRHKEASEYALQMQKKHQRDRAWRSTHEEVGRTLMLAGDYDTAVRQFDHVAARGGWSGRRGTFFAAFASLMGGDAEDAAARFTTLIQGNRSWLAESRYWRARAYALLDRGEEAQADRRWILRHEPDSWYAALVAQQGADTPVIAPFRRGGHWVGVAPSATPLFPESQGGPAPAVPVFRPHQPPTTAPRLSLSGAPWPWGEHGGAALEPPRSPLLPLEYRPPVVDLTGPSFDPEAGREALNAFTNKFGRYWPELRAIHDLAAVGLYDLSGPLMSEWYESWRRDYRRRRRTARRVKLSPEEWRVLFLATRDHHHASRFSYKMWEDVEPLEAKIELRRHAYPLAHDRVVWEACRSHGVDPFLVLGLMRQESVYRATAVSRVGARGAMQIMPRTGHLLADLTRDTTFTAGDLEDPVVSVQYGIRYLGLLLERFDGVFPLAVASYNAGPFNVSSWLEGTGRDLPVDAFVEHIPFRETRDYVKRVTAGYAAYVSLYGPEGSRVVVPERPRADRPEVVDF